MPTRYCLWPDQDCTCPNGEHVQLTHEEMDELDAQEGAPIHQDGWRPTTTER